MHTHSAAAPISQCFVIMTSLISGGVEGMVQCSPHHAAGPEASRAAYRIRIDPDYERRPRVRDAILMRRAILPASTPLRVSGATRERDRCMDGTIDVFLQDAD